MSYCQCCGRNVPAKYVEYYQNIGMLVMRSMRSIKGVMCKRCSRKNFWEFTGLTLVTGWWGMISAIINPFIVLHNVVRVCGSFSLADDAGGGFPVEREGQGGQGGRMPPVQQDGNPYRMK